jgi:hypothetical protein
MTSVAKEKSLEAIPDLVTIRRIAQVESVEFGVLIRERRRYTTCQP